jgi:hypothetical protein
MRTSDQTPPPSEEEQDVPYHYQPESGQPGDPGEDEPPPAETPSRILGDEKDDD